MRPLQHVHPCDLQPGRTYLIQEKRPEYAHLKYKGTFVNNYYPVHSFQSCMMTHLTNVVVVGNRPRGDMCLQAPYWNYYEADAVERAYTNQALREITGDPSFFFAKK